LPDVLPALDLSSSTIDVRSLGRALSSYREPNTTRSLVEILITAGPLALLCASMWAALSFGHIWLYLLLIVPTAGFLLRLFMIQHDCGHGAFFRTRRGNDWVGRVMGILTLTPYDYWRRTHAAHHAGAGNLDRRGIGDIDTLTVSEYQALSRWKRLKYRLYRHPLVMFGIGPFYLFYLQNRIPTTYRRDGWQPWISTMATNAGIALMAGLAIWIMGLGTFLLIHLPVATLASCMGVWLFYVQHQFEETHWAEDQDWKAQEAALHGSSHYDLPPILQWITANIGIHHVHHLASRIPYYRLPQVLRDHPELKDVSRLTLMESFRCVSLVLWDEGQKRLVSFAEMRGRNAASA
jgi:omega-6 fatty acid desaturase (delta-12 desaturase)